MTAPTPAAAGAPAGDEAALLVVRDLVKHFPVRSQAVFRTSSDSVRAVDGVSFDVHRGETLGLVGESGCGKSTLGRCLVRLLEPTAGSVVFEGRDITRLSRRQLRPLRRSMQLVFQDPYASLNPRRRVGDIIAEPLRIAGSSRADAAARVAELLEVVGLRADYAQRFPSEFSGGQRQRVGIARALALKPSLIVADEPVSALDVSIQSQVLNLMEDLQEEFGLTYVFIAHDLGVVRHMSDRIGVMYLGELVELGAVEQVFTAPAHPYTEALLSAIPEVDSDHAVRRDRIILTGEVPSPINKPAGCPFHPRCSYATDTCKTTVPPLAALPDGRSVACHYPLAGAAGG